MPEPVVEQAEMSAPVVKESKKKSKKQNNPVSDDEMHSANDEVSPAPKTVMSKEEKAIRAAKRKACLEKYDGKKLMFFSYPDFCTQDGKLKENQTITFVALTFDQSSGMMEIGRAIWNLNDFHKIKSALRPKMSQLLNFISSEDWVGNVDDLKKFRSEYVKFWSNWVSNLPNNATQLKSLISDVEKVVSLIQDMMTQSGGEWTKQQVEFLVKYQNQMMDFENYMRSINVQKPLSKVQIQRKEAELRDQHFMTAQSRLAKSRNIGGYAKRQWQFVIPMYDNYEQYIAYLDQQKDDNGFSVKDKILRAEKTKFFKNNKKLNSETYQFTPEQETMLMIRSFKSPKKHQLNKFSNMNLVRDSVLGWEQFLGQIAVAKTRGAQLLNPVPDGPPVPPV